MLKKIPFCCTMLVSLLVFCACHEKTPEERTTPFSGSSFLLDSILKKPEGIIRGVELGYSMQQIKNAEQHIPAESDEIYLYYEYKPDTITFFSLAYTFVNNSLEEIEVQIICKNNDTGVLLLSEIKNYYQKKFTAPVMDKGIYVFNCFDSKKSNFSISLSDNSGIENSNISLLIYKEK